MTAIEDLQAFNAAWLQHWTDKDIPAILAMYAEDCLFMDAATAGGLAGRAALGAYLEKLFPMMPGWTYRADELWPMADGFCARWYCEMEGGRRLRGFDFVQMKQGLIARNEVYTHQI